MAVEVNSSNEKLRRMTFWSRHDPINLPKGNTDHWAKCRQRAGGYKVTYGATGLNMNPDLELAGFTSLQGNNTLNQRPRTIQSRSSLRSSYNDKARDGFRYWLIERPKPTKFGKYGIGSYKTVLGIGNAPRT